MNVTDFCVENRCPELNNLSFHETSKPYFYCIGKVLTSLLAKNIGSLNTGGTLTKHKILKNALHIY